MRTLLLSLCLVPAAHADDWPQWHGPQRDGIWREKGLLDRFPKDGPKILWRADVGGGFAGPAVAQGRVFLLERRGDRLAKGKEAPGKDGLPGKERVACFDAATGKPLWHHEYDCPYRINIPNGPRATPTVAEGKVYTLGAMGDIHCLDAAKGDVLWHNNLLAEYKTRPPVWGYSSHLLVTADLVVSLAGGEGTGVVALDRNTGKEKWRALTVEEVGYAPPMAFDIGGKTQVVIWHTEAICGLDPETGKLLWSQKFPVGEPERPAITAATPLRAGNRLFVSCPHHGSLMLELDKDGAGPKVLWKGKSNSVARPDGLHACITSPILQGGHIFGVCVFGEIRCLDAATGKRVWEQATVERKTLGATTFLVPNGDRVFLVNDQGELISARLTGKGYEEIDRAKVIEPNFYSRGRDVVWAHPAFASRCVFLRNEKELVCVSLAAP